jgi:O-antigen/teichoic acid export membrane protein
LFTALHTLLERPGARAAAHNLGWLVAEKGARLVLNVGVGFWVARHLGPAQYGALNYGLAVVGLVSLLAELGLESVVRRDLIRSAAPEATLIATAWGLRLAGGAAAYALLVGGMWLGWATPAERGLLAVLGLTLFQPALMVTDLWFQARLRAKFSVQAQVAALTAGAAMRVALIVAGATLIGFAWAVVAEAAVAVALLAVLARREGLALRAGAFDPALAGRLLREVWPLMLSGFAVILYLRIDAIMLRAMVGDTAVGIYAAAIRFTEIWYFVPMALGSSLLPALLRARERGPEAYAARLQAYYDLSAGLAYVLSVPIALAAPWLIRLAYGPAFAGAAPVLALHVWSSVFVFLGVARGQFLVNESFTRFYLAATVAGAALNIGLNYWLIPRHGPWGAALATLATQAVAAWASSFCFAPVRQTAWMQTRALLIPVRWYHYVRRA